MSNIQVVVRCRGRNLREIESKSPIVIELPEDTATTPSITINTQEHQVSSTSLPSTSEYLSSIHSKTYTVDQVYGSQTDQASIYNQVAAPLFKDFMNGFNVTILAYGQTGTGKTYTMCGDVTTDSSNSNSSSSNSKLTLGEDAGIIPRILSELFNELKKQDVSDYMVKVSFIELYNEELKDLLDGDNNGTNNGGKLRIYESKKSERDSSILIQNLSEVYVPNSKNGLQLLKKGLIKRKTASTKLNDVSSRSHTIFTINLYKKNGMNSDSELYRISKMNLVDLAGSENVSRSGAVNQRAKEAGNINQSLLTLGRVINCLSDSQTSPEALGGRKKSDVKKIDHIPYRESKLTRLLQDSLGGQTKTALIATISPAKVNSEETTSTLEYASRAKNIQNKPQIGQNSELMLKKTLLKDMAREMSKLSNDLIATRTKNGIWLEESNYSEMLTLNESMKADFKEQRANLNGLTEKVQKLHAERLANEEEITKLKNIIEEGKAEAEQLRIKQKASNLKCANYEQQLSKYKEKVSLLGGKQTVLNQFMTEIVQKNVIESIDSVNGIISGMQDSNSRVDKMSSTLKQQLKLMVKKLNETGDSISKGVDIVFQSDIPNLLKELQNEGSKFSDSINESSINIKNGVERIELNNKQFSASLKSDLLTSKMISKKVDEIVEERLGIELEKQQSELKTKLEQITMETFSKSKAFLSNSLKEVSTEFSDMERQAIGSNHEKWYKQSKELNSIALDENTRLKVKFEQFQSKNSDLVSTTSDKMSKLIKDQMEPGLVQLQNSQEGKFIEERIDEMKVAVMKKNEESSVKLRNIENGLSRVKNGMDTERSPIRSPSKSPIRGASTSPYRSPIKESNFNQVTKLSKIPQLTRNSSWDKENAKRRRV
ncbi:kinesin-like protein Cin8p [[Candida] railenensis]|uniref:Kinesin-like protein n=1 Tax=[Candida] railenensis TaxID=45579 RepID=A0A9P0QRS2_9ASCO|nr:kinesin-like protein Cin8p [[Candida] railenensis]